MTTEDEIVITGEKPTPGKYECRNCGQIVTISSGDTMPPCPKCDETKFDKYIELEIFD